MDKIHSNVMKYVEKKDIEAVKLTLTGLAYMIDSFETFKDSTEYAIQKLGDIFDEDDGAEFDKEKTISNYKYIARLMMDNFSKKKYDAVVEIGLEVFANQDKKQGKNTRPFQQMLGHWFRHVKNRMIETVKWAKRNPLAAIAIVIVIVVITLVVIAYINIKKLK